jgi:predicted AAA+ superfamily ATPase
MAYAGRILDDELDELLPALPAIAIEGAKGVGKTETASRRATTVHALDDPDRFAVAEADPRRLLEADPPILIDEWQRLPEIWDLVRRSVDGGASPGRYLLTGSASPDGSGRHSGAARIPTIRMRPLTLAERDEQQSTVSLGQLLKGSRPAISGETGMTVEDYTDEILSSGFPGLRGMTGRPLRTQLDGYLARIVDRDFAELGHELRNPAGLHRWMRAYAAASSTSASFEKIRDAATGGEGEKPSRDASRPYRNVLERLWILDPVPAWQPTRRQLSRLGAAPKHQLADPALAARLLGAGKAALLENRDLGPPMPRDGTLLGALFESLVTLCIRVYAQGAEAEVGHLRTFSGDHEVDLIVEREDGRVIAVEVKLKRTIDAGDLRHLKWLAHKVGDELLDALIVTTGNVAYRRADGIGVVPAALLGP